MPITGAETKLVRLEGPGTATSIVDAAAATRRDRWSEALVGAEPKHARSSPIEKSAVGEVPSEAAERVGDQRKQRREQKKEKVPGVKATPRELGPDEQREVARLAEIDRRVRAHEAAHLVAAGGLARGGAAFTYRTGPDGKQYAVGGEVEIDMAPVDDSPEQTIARAQAAEAAALAPADPSPQDRQVAMQARRLAIDARRRLSEKARTSEEAGAKSPAAAPNSGGAAPSADQPSEPGARLAHRDARVRAYASGREAAPGLLLSFTA